MFLPAHRLSEAGNGAERRRKRTFPKFVSPIRPPVSLALLVLFRFRPPQKRTKRGPRSARTQHRVPGFPPAKVVRRRTPGTGRVLFVPACVGCRWRWLWCFWCALCCFHYFWTLTAKVCHSTRNSPMLRYSRNHRSRKSEKSPTAVLKPIGFRKIKIQQCS